jgi:hypothetical protein
MALAATATHHHFEPRTAATIVNGALAKKMPKTTSLPKDDPGRVFANAGENLAAQKRARQRTPAHPMIGLRRPESRMPVLYTGSLRSRSATAGLVIHFSGKGVYQE